MNVAAINRIALLASADLAGAEVALRRIPNDDPNGCFIPCVLAQVRDGQAHLCEIHYDGVKVGITVFAFEEMGEGHKEFISVATSCPRTPGIRFDLEKVLLELARRNGCKSIRQHTCRHGLVKDALANGWHTAEIVLRKYL